MSQLSAHGKEAHPSRKKILTICEITIATLSEQTNWSQLFLL